MCFVDITVQHCQVVLIQAVLHPMLQLIGAAQNRVQLMRRYNEPLLVMGALEAANFRRYMEAMANREDSQSSVTRRPAATVKATAKAQPQPKVGVSSLRRLQRFYNWNPSSDSDS